MGGVLFRKVEIWNWGWPGPVGWRGVGQGVGGELTAGISCWIDQVFRQCQTLVSTLGSFRSSASYAVADLAVNDSDTQCHTVSVIVGISDATVVGTVPLSVTTTSDLHIR